MFYWLLPSKEMLMSQFWRVLLLQTLRSRFLVWLFQLLEFYLLQALWALSQHSCLLSSFWAVCLWCIYKQIYKQKERNFKYKIQMKSNAFFYNALFKTWSPQQQQRPKIRAKQNACDWPMVFAPFKKEFLPRTKRFLQLHSELYFFFQFSFHKWHWSEDIL